VEQESWSYKRKKRTECVALERKNPPFPPQADEGWGTLKFIEWVA